MFLFAAIDIKLASKGPVFYRAVRAGKDGMPFTIVKFRTMHILKDGGSRITAGKDPRIFGWGSFLRKTKIDELPQLMNILKGEMSFVGPRPEDMDIVRERYTPLFMKTLDLKPGLSSPGSVYYYTHLEDGIDSEDPERYYVEKLLPFKLAFELVYIDRQSLVYDLRIMFRTALTVLRIALGKKEFKLPPEYDAAMQYLERMRSETADMPEETKGVTL